MGLFAVIFSVIIVILQTSSVLMGRSAHEWSYPLLKVSPNTTYLAEVNKLFDSDTRQHKASNDSAVAAGNVLEHLIEGEAPTSHIALAALPETWDPQINLSIHLYFQNASHAMESQAACLQAAWRNEHVSKFPTFCLFNIHTKQKIESILEDFNPHLILLILAILHSTLTMAKMNKLVWSSTKDEFKSGNQPQLFQNPHQLSVPVSFAAYCLLVVIVYVIVNGRNSHLMQYPTIFVTIILLLFGVWFIVREKKFADNHLWFSMFYLHLVSVPTAVLSISLVGSRFWTDIVTHGLLLSVATNGLFLERNAKDFISQKLSQIIYFVIPLFSLYTAILQWGQNDNWKYTIGLMGCSSLLPFFIFPVFLGSMEDQEKKYKYLSKMVLFTSSGALISLIINLAMFYD